MKAFIATLLLAAGLLSQTASAESRVEAGYNFANTGVDSWGARAEWDAIKLPEAGGIQPTLFVGAGFELATEASFVDAVYTASVGAQLPLTKNWLVKVQYDRTFVESFDDLNAGRATLAYQGDKWRFAGQAVKMERADWYGVASAERKVLGNLALGVAATFDEDSYNGGTVFAAYSF